MFAPVPVIPLPDLTAPEPLPPVFDLPLGMLVDAPAPIPTATPRPRPRPRPGNTTVVVNTVAAEPVIPYVEHNFAARNAVTFDTYVGQDAVKEELRVFIADARERYDRMPHTMFASGIPGVGKTTLAMCVAAEMKAPNLHEFAPPFSIETLFERILGAEDGDIVFIDEVHTLSKADAERLLLVIEEGKIILNGVVHHTPEVTFIVATTNKDKLPPAFLSRFMIKPYFVRYSWQELAQIADTNFCRKFDVTLPQDVLDAIGKACQDTPRIARELVIAARALLNAKGSITPESLLKFKQLEPDGMTRAHIAYITALYQFGGREREFNGALFTEYVMGQHTLMTQLNEDVPGIQAIERFVIDRALVDLTPRGRRLTDRGVAAAKDYIARGMGLGVS